MEGKETVPGEDVKSPNAEAEEQSDAKATFTREEVEALKKKMQSDYEKGVQKLHEKSRVDKQTYESVLEAINKVSENKAYLVECYENNPEVAKIILDKYYDGQSIDDYMKSIDYQIDYNDPKVRQKQIELEAQRIADKKTIDKTKSDFIEKLKMTPDEQKKFEEAFDERRMMKSFKVADIDKHLTKAYKEISDVDVSEIRSTEIIAKSMAT